MENSVRSIESVIPKSLLRGPLGVHKIYWSVSIITLQEAFVFAVKNIKIISDYFCFRILFVFSANILDVLSQIQTKFFLD